MPSDELPESIERAISRKCGAIVSLGIVWEGAARKALRLATSAESVALLIAEFDSPRNLEGLLAGLAEARIGLDDFLAKLRYSVDESSYDLSSWLGALEATQAYLLQNGRAASPDSIVGYIRCAAEFGSSGQSRDSLEAVVEEMLERYGFEGQEGCGA